jgi:hypothetical protein
MTPQNEDRNTTRRPEDELERQLGALTAWSGPQPQLWRRALKAAGSRSGRRLLSVVRLLNRRSALGLVAAVVFVAVGITIAMNLPERVSTRLASMSGVGRGAQLYAFDTESRYDSLSFRYQMPSASGGDATHRGVRRLRADNSPYFTGEQPVAGGMYEPTPERFLNPSSGDQEDDLRGGGLAFRGGADQAGQADDGRHVIRKATMELVCEDVRAAFLKAQHLLNVADSEFVEDSTITGTGENTQANLTLRVAADRLGEVLNELRQLGEVRSEQLGGQDVTRQVVDVEARLRNEQRVEAELLDLLETRQDAPLKEILELREKLGEVRGAIERLTGQRERLARLVSLATVLVIIRPPNAEPEPEQPGIGAYFLDSLGGAWTSGLVFLADTFAGLLAVLIGGLVWWVLLAAGLIALRNWLRRREARAVAQA